MNTPGEEQFLAQQTLRARLGDIADELDGMRAAIAEVNDLELRTEVEAYIALATETLAQHPAGDSPDLADNLIALASQTRRLHIPAEDPSLGKTRTLQDLRAAQGRNVMALHDALDAARTLGLRPHARNVLAPGPAEVPAAATEPEMRVIARQLDALTQVVAVLLAQTGQTVQNNRTYALVTINQYASTINQEANLAKAEVTIKAETRDIGALAGLVMAMQERTAALLRQLRGWVDQVSPEIIATVRRVGAGVNRVAGGVRAAALRFARRFAPKPPEEEGAVRGPPVRGQAEIVDPVETLEATATVGPPPGFNRKAAVAMILDGQAPPVTWRPFIAELHLGDTDDFADLAPLQGLTALQTLFLGNTQVADLAPLQGLTALQRLEVDSRQVTNEAIAGFHAARLRLGLGKVECRRVAAAVGTAGRRR